MEWYALASTCNESSTMLRIYKPGCAALQVGFTMCVSTGNPPPIPWVVEVRLSIGRDLISICVIQSKPSSSVRTWVSGQSDVPSKSMLQCFWVLWYNIRLLRHDGESSITVLWQNLPLKCIPIFQGANPWFVYVFRPIRTTINWSYFGQYKQLLHANVTQL